MGVARGLIEVLLEDFGIQRSQRFRNKSCQTSLLIDTQRGVLAIRSSSVPKKELAKYMHEHKRVEGSFESLKELVQS